MKRAITLALLLMLAGASSAFACTMVMAAKGDVMLAGNNEDFNDPDTKMWVYPAGNGKYGRICFGFGNGSTQGGMNDQGLFIDGNALAPVEWKAEPGKPLFRGNLMDHILEHCATVDEAIAFFKKYNFTVLRQAKFPIADAKGESVVVEWGQGKLQCIKRTGMYQISTNFVQTDFKPEDYPCARFKMAEKIFKAANEVSVALIRSILSTTHGEYYYPTVYSNIFDLKNKKIYLYNFHNFEEVRVFDLAEELEKGEKTYDIPSLFSVKTQAARLFERFSPRKGSEELLKTIDEEGIDKAVKRYHRLKNAFRKMYYVDISEREINTLGYILLRDNRVKEAIEILKLNTADHPESWNAYDSLAEAYMKNGDKDLAIEYYNKSLQLNPDNENGKKMLKDLSK